MRAGFGCFFILICGSVLGQTASPPTGAIPASSPADNAFANLPRDEPAGHLDLEMKPGKYVLRLGAIDRNSQRIGTVDVPIRIPGPETAQK